MPTPEHNLFTSCIVFIHRHLILSVSHTEYPPVTQGSFFSCSASCHLFFPYVSLNPKPHSHHTSPLSHCRRLPTAFCSFCNQVVLNTLHTPKEILLTPALLTMPDLSHEVSYSLEPLSLFTLLVHDLKTYLSSYCLLRSSMCVSNTEGFIFVYLLSDILFLPSHQV